LFGGEAFDEGWGEEVEGVDDEVVEEPCCAAADQRSPVALDSEEIRRTALDSVTCVLNGGGKTKTKDED